MFYNWPSKIGNKYINLCPLAKEIEWEHGYQNATVGPSKDEGLLFIFNDEKPRKFHMRNVKFDLDLLGFNEYGTLVFVIGMEKNSEKLYNTLPCKYAVETEKGWAAGLDIGASKLTIPSTQEITITNRITEAAITYAIMGNLDINADINIIPTANFIGLGWLDLNKDGIMDIYQVDWHRFNPVDMNKNKPWLVDEKEKLGELVKNKRERYLKTK